jgi:hypothetical protein
MQVLVMAVPLTPELKSFTVECSECGPIEIIESEKVEDACRAHLSEHGAEDIHEVDRG